MTEPEPLQQIDRTYVLSSGHKLSYFAGCDYFRLSSHPKVIQALDLGLKKYGLTVAASRLTTGNHALYLALEEKLASFFNAPAALLVPSGYVANLVVGQGLAGQFSHALIDAGAHPSLSDAARLLECPILKFQHRSATSLAEAVSRCGPGAKLILLTDGMFSRDGAVAPLREYLVVLPPDAWVLTDDAHGAGIIGQNGRGTVEYCGTNRRRLIQTITLSKAFGSYGGAILCSQQLREKIEERSQLFVGSTPLPLPLANAALQALTILETDPAHLSQLKRNSGRVKLALKNGGFALPPHPGPILALKPASPSARAQVKRALLKAGIYPACIHYPGGPASGYFRFVISSEHSSEQLQNLSKTLLQNARLFEPLNGPEPK